MWCIKIIIYIYCKRFHPKSSFYEKVKITKKKIVVLDSFVTIGSFDCDHTLMNMLHVNVIIAIVHLVVVEDLEGSIGG